MPQTSRSARASGRIRWQFQRVDRRSQLDLPASKDRLVLDAVGTEDEMGEGLVRDDLLAGMAGLGEIDGRRRIFGGGVLVALEGEIDEQARCRSPPGAPPFGASTSDLRPTRSSDRHSRNRAPLVGAEDARKAGPTRTGRRRWRCTRPRAPKARTPAPSLRGARRRKAGSLRREKDGRSDGRQEDDGGAEPAKARKCGQAEAGRTRRKARREARREAGQLEQEKAAREVAMLCDGAASLLDRISQAFAGDLPGRPDRISDQTSSRCQIECGLGRVCAIPLCYDRPENNSPSVGSRRKKLQFRAPRANPRRHES